MNNRAQPAQAGPRNGAGDARKVFDKKHLEPQELLLKLRKQGMVVNDATALPYLQQVGGYRMKGYWYHLQDSETKQFRADANFDDVIARYEFDRKLRRVTGDALERIELMVRSTITNVMSKHGGPHWFMNEDFFSKPRNSGDGGSRPRSFIDRISEEVHRSKQKPFISHYQTRYATPELPPSWVISECLSFGSWSHAYPTIANVGYKKEISRRFRVEDPKVFESWLHAFSVLRNTVAHHGRLLGIQLGVAPRQYVKRGVKFEQGKARTFFATAAVINYVCQSIKRGPRLRMDLKALFAENPGIPLEHALGFSPGWEDLPLWTPEMSPTTRKSTASAQRVVAGK